MKAGVLVTGLIGALLLFSGCSFKTCADGTFYGGCSATEFSYYCNLDGNLVVDENKCGFGKFNFDNNFFGSPDVNFNIGPEEKCGDGTKFWECAKNKPDYCENGEVVKKAGLCGCPDGMEIAMGECTQIIESEATAGEFEYVLRGESGKIKVSPNKKLKDYLAGLSRTYYCTPKCPSKTQLELTFLNNKKQKPELDKIVRQIKKKTSNNDDRARIAISLVQRIPYDMNSLLTDSNYERFPYEVIFDNNGVCGEKSKLLVFFLRELGFGTALLSFEEENHEAVGIKCPVQYSYKNAGYCFIESTAPSIITDSDANYMVAGKLQSMPEILKISDGNSFDSVKEEFEDNLQYKKLVEITDENSYGQWRALRSKYGFQETSCDANQNYCDGLCLASCEPHYIFACSRNGGYCMPDPSNCPSQMIACNEGCWPACEKGDFKCETFGGICETMGGH